MVPGEVFAAVGEIELNAGQPTSDFEVANTGDRPIQVGCIIISPRPTRH